MTSVGREITKPEEIEALLNRAHVCRIALFDGEYPYIVPMFFGYNITGGKLELYFPCDEKGKKFALIKADNKAAFEIDKLMEIVKSDAALGFSAAYQSITGTGTIENVTGIDKITGLNLIMKKYRENLSDIKYSEQTLNSVAVLKLTAGEFCCKEHNNE